MQATVRVGRLTVRPARGGRLGQDVVARQRAEAFLPQLEPADSGVPDHSILVLRRLEWPIDRLTPYQARELIVDHQRSATRPSRATVAVDCAAVLFADEVELLTCLTRDALNGALDQWYWQRLAPIRRGTIGAVLTAAWLDRPRWLPAALARLPFTVAVDAVAMLSPTETLHVRHAVQREFGWAATVVARPCVQTNRRTYPATEAPLGQPSDMVEERSAEPYGGVPQPTPTEAALSAEQRSLLRLTLTLAGHATTAVGQPLAQRSVRTPVPEKPAIQLRQSAYPSSNVARPAAVSTMTAEIADRQDTESADVPSEVSTTFAGPGLFEEKAAAPTFHPELKSSVEAEVASPSWRDAMRSSAASSLYLVNLLPLIDHDESVAGWGLLERLTRELLDDELGPPDDPLWELLATLDGREPETALRVPTPPSELGQQALGLLGRHHVDVEAFAQSGRVAVTATHIDVLLGIDQIDITVRACGLDRDPGWTPELGHVIAFHFLGGG